VTASHIERLNVAKERAVREERFQHAEELKQVIEQLKEVGAEIATLEAEKLAAVKEEDYALASKLKTDIEQMRVAAYSQLPNIEPSEDEQFGEFNPRDIFSNVPTLTLPTVLRIDVPPLALHPQQFSESEEVMLEEEGEEDGDEEYDDGMLAVAPKQ
jgi:hypothetical protein